LPHAEGIWFPFPAQTIAKEKPDVVIQEAVERSLMCEPPPEALTDE
jgi:hypothetical protein